MSLYNRIQESLILPSSDLVSGQSIARSLQFLLESQYWPHSKQLEFQEERLQMLIRHAYENVPFYRNMFREHHLVPGDIKNRADLQKLPVINKDDFRIHPPDYYIASVIPRDKIIHLSSSGSTGEPFSYAITKEAFSMNYACAIRGWYWMGYRLGDTYAKLSQNPRKGFKKKLQDKITRSLYLFIRDLTKTELLEVIKKLNHYRPDFIRCYPDPLLFLSILIKEGHKLEYVPKGINTTGNILTSNTKLKIEESFKSPVYDSYSCEGSAQFFQDPNRTSYLASMEYAVTEILDGSGSPSVLGRHVTTDLWNFAMPFIRYDTQDIIEKSEKPLESEIRMDSFKEIKGRNSDILITPSGKYLIVHTFTIFFEYFSEIEQFQVIQDLPDRVRVLLVANNNFTGQTGKKILSGLEDLIGNDVKINLEIVKNIPLLASGKRKFIVRNQEIKLPF